MTIFRYFNSTTDRSDRTAGDRRRHREKVRQAIKENIADIVSEESIIGKNRDKVIKVPLRGIKEYRFVYGDNAPGVGTGDGETQPGDVVGQQQGQGKSGDKAGDQAGEDYYETDITLDELVEIMFEDLNLPRLAQKEMRELPSLRRTKIMGTRKKGIAVRLDKKRTMKQRLRRALAEHADLDAARTSDDPADRFPFHLDDMRYKHTVEDVEKQSNAVVIFVMDTSGSMDTTKKYYARSFFFLLYQFIQARYENTELAFIAHTTEAKVVNEEEFFTKGESGGTFISSGYQMALDVIAEHYHPALYNIYVFHASDGDNFSSDNEAAVNCVFELLKVVNLFGYVEIKPYGSYYSHDSMLGIYGNFASENFATTSINRKEDIWPSFRKLLASEVAGS